MPFFHTLEDDQIGDVSSVDPIGFGQSGTSSLRPGACSLTSEVVGSSVFETVLLGRWKKVGDFFFGKWRKICGFLKKHQDFLMGKQICYQLCRKDFLEIHHISSHLRPLAPRLIQITSMEAGRIHMKNLQRNCRLDSRLPQHQTQRSWNRSFFRSQVLCYSFLLLAFCYECKCILDFSCRATTVWSTPRAQGKPRLHAIATKCSKSISGARSEAQHTPAHANSSRSCSAITEKRTEI